MVDCGLRMRIIAPARRSNTRPNHDRDADMPTDPPETIEVDQETVACDGNGGALGHPRVYLTLDADGDGVAEKVSYNGFQLVDGEVAARRHDAEIDRVLEASGELEAIVRRGAACACAARCRASASGRSSTASRPSSASPAGCATTARACSPRSRASRRRSTASSGASRPRPRASRASLRSSPRRWRRPVRTSS